MVNKVSTAHLFTVFQKLKRFNGTVFLLLLTLACISCACLYSAAGGSWTPWANKQWFRFMFGMTLMLAISVVDIRKIYSLSYVLYGLCLFLLLGVEILGSIHKGGQRWIDLYIFKLQPSELMKVSLVLALASYFHKKNHQDVGRFSTLIPPLIMAALPTLLVLRQPDLGTALILLMTTGMMFFIAGVRYWKFATVIGSVLLALPIFWTMLHEYQRGRVLTFLNPERDPKGAGYHIIQSKIALGSGGFYGKGWMKGTQSQLSFLPEKQTDFIYTLWGEEFGMLGCMILLLIYGIIIGYGYYVALISRHRYGQLLALGLTSVLFLYVFINIGMVMDILPVVGVPLPLMSYGGTASLTFLMSMGLIFSVKLHHDVRMNW
jgi:rod shape determining protein RodA